MSVSRTDPTHARLAQAGYPVRLVPTNDDPSALLDEAARLIRKASTVGGNWLALRCREVANQVEDVGIALRIAERLDQAVA